MSEAKVGELPDTAGDSRPTQDTAKRRQILEGARSVFRARGYDGASMDQVAKTAGVSKGTLYVYFENKAALFRALILEERLDQAETLLECENTEGDVREQLSAIGRRFLKKMLRPERLSTLRMVIGATETFPEFGALLYEAGPRRGRERLARVFEQRVAHGDLACKDPLAAASHFIDLCGSGILRRALFMPGTTVPQEEIEANIASAVDVFMAAYGRKR
ncbi:MAG: TetR family transcriptional regulator [Stappia sp.]|uniref:TetR/AcrR family transcriptional regulator n=1 Tax=Stappia sp. TaxID=1870903 RepID=UPI000C50975C|nr:TetR/AcrR family transcriptional regulator [Stappia sp.]MAB01062.1 TetR family transcriptional regulator [Stappia sp.]MBM19918.1 TetR family transcriptional regulator [Stappia sp.]